MEHILNIEKQGEPSIPPSTKYSPSEARSKSIVIEGKGKRRVHLGSIYLFFFQDVVVRDSVFKLIIFPFYFSQKLFMNEPNCAKIHELIHTPLPLTKLSCCAL